MARKRTKPGKIRLTEVAKLAGVSPITASRFFRTPEALSLGKRVRVESAAKELGYMPHLGARALGSQRTEVSGVLIPSLTNNVFSDVLRGIYDALDGSRYSIQLANTRYSILQEEKLLRLFLAQKPAGLIVTGIDQTPESRSILESVDCPIVQIMEIGENPVDMMIGFSHSDACQAAIAHLLAQGCRRRQISVPEQMLIMGFNDLEFMASAVPALTSVRTNRYEMGRDAATMVIEAIEGRRREQRIVDLGFTVVTRQSSLRSA